METDTAYLTVAAWPEGWSAREQTLAVVKAAGLHPADAERRVAPAVPLVVARMPRVAAEAAGAELHRLRVEAISIGAAWLAVVPPVLRARQLVRRGPGRYSLELWRGPTTDLAMERVWLIVRARIRRVKLGEIKAEATVVGDEFTGYEIETSVTRERSVRVREIIEMHTRDGARIRIDGSKFNFDAVEGARSATDVGNADRLALQLSDEATGAIVDTEFRGMGGGSLVKARDLPISTLDRQRFPDDDPVFEFYSVWVSERYRRKLGARGSRG